MTRAEELSEYIETLVYRMKVSEQTSCEVVSLPEMQVLSFIAKRGCVRMSVIAEHLLLSLSNLTAIVDRLTERQLVERNRSEEDRRVVLVTLTKAGEEIAAKSHEQKLDLAQQMLLALSESDQEKLLGLMRKIASRMTPAEKEPLS